MANQQSASEEKNKKEELRCFLAAEIPEEIKKKVAQLEKEMQQLGIRFVSPENVHITLKFLGNVSKQKLEHIEKLLKTVSFASFSFRIAGIGFFPSEKNPKVIWLGAASKELQMLAEKINTLLKKDFEEESFTAHLTIGRVKGKIDKEKLQVVAKKYAETIFGTVLCDRFALKRSILGKKGSTYTTIAEFKAQ